jgi:hypothetical protein
MRRRDFIAGLRSAVAWPPAVRAESANELVGNFFAVVHPTHALPTRGYQDLLLLRSSRQVYDHKSDVSGSFQSDIFLLIADCRANDHRFAATYNREFRDIAGGKKAHPIVQI